MKLLLDIGNTRIKWACASNGALQQSGCIVHRGKSVGSLCEALRSLPVEPEFAAAVNVAGDALGAAVAEVVHDRWGLSLRLIGAASQWGEVRNGYTDPTQLGADRWAAIVAAWQHYRADLCVVDAGTAVTIDLVRADGGHLGGVILAGRLLAQTALLGETADLADFARGAPGPGDFNWFGRSTSEAIARGVDFALSAAVEAAVRAFPRAGFAPTATNSAAAMAASPLVVLTGGDADAVLPQLSHKYRMHPQLVLEGLVILAE